MDCKIFSARRNGLVQQFAFCTFYKCLFVTVCKHHLTQHFVTMRPRPRPRRLVRDRGEDDVSGRRSRAETRACEWSGFNHI